MGRKSLAGSGLQSDLDANGTIVAKCIKDKWFWTNVISTSIFLSRTPLMAAVGNGFFDCANLLVSEGANVLRVDVYHRSALHRAVSMLVASGKYV